MLWGPEGARSENRPSESVSTTGAPSGTAVTVIRALGIGYPVASATTRPLIVAWGEAAAGARGDCPRAGSARALRIAAVRARLVRATFVVWCYFACAAFASLATIARIALYCVVTSVTRAITSSTFGSFGISPRSILIIPLSIAT
jgi:hypothetical protein